jgi:TPR repeat protein
MGVYEQQAKRPDEAISWFKRGQDIELSRASYLLAKMYQQGQGIEPSAEHAVELLKKAADLGEIDAYFDLYLAYKEGRGVRKNKKSASKYLKLAKENHHLEAASIVE